MKRLVWIVVFLLALGSLVQAERRGLWVVRDALTDKEQIDRAINLARDLGIDFLLLQVNGRGEAYYESALFPKAKLTADFDPLAYAIAQSRRAGLEVHAWVNLLTMGSFVYRPQDPRHVLNQHPEWFMVDAQGNNILTYERGNTYLPAPMLEPALPEVQAFLRAMVRELVENYDVDGIHLDYVRYPTRDFGYSSQNRSAFAKEWGVDPLDLAGGPDYWQRRLGPEGCERILAAWDGFRRDKVTELVRQISLEIRGLKPDLKLSAAVYGDLKDSREERLQDWGKWLADGLLDFAVPMLYSTSNLLVDSQVQQILKSTAGTLYIGLGAYALVDEPEKLVDQIQKVRARGASGVVLFSFNAIVDHPRLLALLQQVLG
ncbi:MAG: glycoside hydrolase family 10 protein [Limnochordia bacterium]